MGRTIQSNQRNLNWSIRARKMQKRAPQNETLKRIQPKEILQLAQTRISTKSIELRAGRPPTSITQQNKTELRIGLIPREGYVGSSISSAAQTTKRTFLLPFYYLGNSTTNKAHLFNYILRPYKGPQNRFLISLCSTPPKK